VKYPRDESLAAWVSSSGCSEGGSSTEAAGQTLDEGRDVVGRSSAAGSSCSGASSAGALGQPLNGSSR
jgi:hypothetical protein